MAVTSVWETWMIFNLQNVEAWVKTFLGRAEEEGEEQEVEEEIIEEVVEKKGKWKSVTETSGKEAKDVGGYTSPVQSAEGEEEEGQEGGQEEGQEGGQEEWQEGGQAGRRVGWRDEGEEGDVDGEAMEEEDVDGVPMEEEDVDGEPMEEEEEEVVDGLPMEEAPAKSVSIPEPMPERPVVQQPPDPRPTKRQRMKAADMFAD